MVLKVYTSELSGSKEIKKHQQRVLLILDSKNVKYEKVDITQPDQEEAKEFMRKEAKAPREGQPPVTPQIFNDDQYCGDYDDFDLANEDDQLFQFLKLEPEEISSAQQELENNKTANGSGSRESSETPADTKPEETNTENFPNEKNEKEELSDQEVSAPLSDDDGTQNNDLETSVPPSNEEEETVKHVVIDEVEEISQDTEEKASPINEMVSSEEESDTEGENENGSNEEDLGGEKSFPPELLKNNDLNSEIDKNDDIAFEESNTDSQFETV